MAITTTAIVGTGFALGFVCGRCLSSNVTPVLKLPPPPPPLPPPPSKRKKSPTGGIISLVKEDYLPGKEVTPIVSADPTFVTPPAQMRPQIAANAIEVMLRNLKKPPPLKSLEEKRLGFEQIPLFIEIKNRKQLSQ